MRWTRFGLRSLLEGRANFTAAALRATCSLGVLTLREHLSRKTESVECNLCGWSGPSFYPNVGRGYDERNVTCPGCDTLGRHRTLLAVLATRTSFFQGGGRVIEVAPRRSFQEYCLSQPGISYLSFDLQRFAMRRDDLCKMSFPDSAADFFLCYHVLEHVQDEDAALREIHRVLAAGGLLVAQVPMDWRAEKTIEFERPDPQDAFHVRRYGRDFAERLSRRGFTVQVVDVQELVSPETYRRFGLDPEPVFLARKEAGP